jgi:succinate dehydrogenase/fumarate reductase flavoprotein subunit
MPIKSKGIIPNYQEMKTDVLIIGSEGAGSRAAIEAARHGVQVCMLTKGKFGMSGSTIVAGADVDVDSRNAKHLLNLPGDERDSPEAFFEDILTEGKDINNQKLVKLHVEQAPLRLKEMANWGMKITGLIHAPGHRYPRGVYTSGVEIMRVLKAQVKNLPIKIMEFMLVLDLLLKEGRVAGAVVLNLLSGKIFVISAKAIILATGGGMTIYSVYTSPQDLTGDGQAMAWRAGADLVDMEMIQFLPCTFVSPPIWRGFGFPFALGPMGGLDSWLLNKYGNRFMKDWDPERMERTTRDRLSIAIMNEILEGRGSSSNGVYLSFAHLPYNLIDFLKEWYAKPTLTSDWNYKGFNFKLLIEDIKKGYAIEVAPACHFFMGGIRINEKCETSVSGLFAAGEVAGGLHGANRLQGNACTQILVQGALAGKWASRFAAKRHRRDPLNKRLLEEVARQAFAPLERQHGISPYEVKNHIQKLAWENVGVIRTGANLKSTIQEIERIKKEKILALSCFTKEAQYNPEWIQSIQLQNQITLLEIIAKSALLREESRGAHFRRDFPNPSTKMGNVNIWARNRQGNVQLLLKPVVRI